MRERLYLFDTTLRDGAQTNGVDFTLTDKLAISRMNESDSDANTKAIDSLLNYETVKYFSAEQRETVRYDRSMARYEEASVKAYTSLAVLNAGQAIIFALGLAAAMVLCATGVERGTNTVGDFVMLEGPLATGIKASRTAALGRDRALQRTWGAAEVHAPNALAGRSRYARRRFAGDDHRGSWPRFAR